MDTSHSFMVEGTMASKPDARPPTSTTAKHKCNIDWNDGKSFTKRARPARITETPANVRDSHKTGAAARALWSLNPTDASLAGSVKPDANIMCEGNDEDDEVEKAATYIVTQLSTSIMPALLSDPKPADQVSSTTKTHSGLLDAKLKHQQSRVLLHWYQAQCTCASSESFLGRVVQATSAKLVNVRTDPWRGVEGRPIYTKQTRPTIQQPPRQLQSHDLQSIQQQHRRQWRLLLQQQQQQLQQLQQQQQQQQMQQIAIHTQAAPNQRRDHQQHMGGFVPVQLRVAMPLSQVYARLAQQNSPDQEADTDANVNAN